MKRFTNVNIFEEEKTFVLSSNAIAKVIKVTSNSNNEIIPRSIKQNPHGNEKRNSDAATTNAKFLLNEVVTEATKVANRKNLRKNLDQCD